MATHLDLRQDAPGWMQIITGSPSKLDNESMRLLRSILPDRIIRRLKEVVSLLHCGAGCASAWSGRSCLLLVQPAAAHP